MPGMQSHGKIAGELQFFLFLGKNIQQLNRLRISDIGMGMDIDVFQCANLSLQYAVNLQFCSSAVMQFLSANVLAVFSHAVQVSPLPISILYSFLLLPFHLSFFTVPCSLSLVH